MISFEVNGRFFAGLGTPFIQPSAQMFELDLTTLTWIPRASAPGAHYLIDAYVVNGKAYIIPVYVDNNSKIIEYNPELDSWRVVTDFNSLDAQYPIGFALGTNIYFGMGPGALNSGTMRKWFRFDTQTETVVQLNDVPVASSQSCAFKIGNTGYVYNVGQDNKDMYRYNQDLDTWDLMCSFADNRLANASAFGDASFGYIVFGQKSLPGENVSSNELWRFEPLDLTLNNEINNAKKNIQLFSDADGSIHINFPLPEVYSISVYDLTGRCISSESIMVSESNFNWINKYTAKGLHFFQIKNSKNEVLLSKKIVLQ
jgi:hypothetical protein